MAQQIFVSDQEFRESADNRERMYEVELKRAPVEATNEAERTFMDRLGRGRWPVDYITARQRGYSHAAAMQVERVEIRKAAGLPATEPMPTPPVPPEPVEPPTSPDVPGVRDNMDRFATFYAQRCGSTGWEPDETTTRDERVDFLQDTILAYRAKTGDTTSVMKRASATRPISDEALVFVVAGPDYRRFWDFIISGGSKDWKIAVHGSGDILPMDQILVDPRTLGNMEG